MSDTKGQGSGWKDKDISEALNLSVATIERVRRRLVEEGLSSALGRKPQKNRRPRRLDGEQEAYLIALTCSELPTGATGWTMRMLADQMVELGHVETVSHETVRQTLKKMNLNHG